MVKESAQDAISLSTIGFNSADASFGKKEEISFMKHFEPGHQDTLNYGSLEQAIQFLDSIGMDVVSERVSEISKLAKKRFTEMDLLDDAVVNRRNHSNIFNIKGDTVLFQKLKENGIVCSLRDKGIRVSFHFYNTVADLDQLCRQLA
jgi:Selenocysteine lyase